MGGHRLKDASGRLGAALSYAAKRAGERLAPSLEAANTTTYLAAMGQIARAFGVAPPEAVRDPHVLAQTAALAAISAQSIAQTRATRMASLVAEHGSRTAAQPAYNDWQRGQQARIAQYEASQAAGRAARDFAQANSLIGTERIEPGESACDDICQADIDLGEVPIGTIGTNYPAHPNCPHEVVRSYDLPDGAEHLWLGD